MTEHIIKLPDVGEGITEAEIVEWHVAVGDQIAEDDLLGAVMTDKAAVDIPSPVAGVVSRLGGDIGEVLAVGSEYLSITVSNDSQDPRPSASASRPDASAQDAAAYSAPERAGTSSSQSLRQAGSLPGKQGDVAHAIQAKVPRALAAPSVRRRAYEHGVALHYVRGSGPAGRITHSDLDNYLGSRSGQASATGGQSGGGSSSTLAPQDLVEEIKLAGMRRQIAQRMQKSKSRIPHFSYVEETDVTTLEDLRAQLNNTRKSDQPKLTLLPFMVMALVRALDEFPQMNARFDDDAQVIRRHSGVHLGIAAQTDRGLMVPVIHHSQTLDIWEIAAKIAELAEAARSGRIRRDDLTGATITLTSLGALGGIVTTPVINYPEVAIVGINRIMTRPVFIEDRVVPRKLMNLSSSFDHRVVDGFEAAQFVQRLRSYIEFPSTIFIPGAKPR